MARILPPGERRRGWIFRWPRQEAISISDSRGGLIRDFGIKIAQGTGIFGILLIGLALGGFTLWSLPPALWWVALSLLYFAATVGLPVVLTHTLLRKAELWKWAIAMIATMGLWAIIAWGVFYRFIWEPLDIWTVGFFTFRLPVPSLLTMAGGSLLSLGLGAWTLLGGERPVTPLFLALGSGCIAAWLATAEYAQPGLAFYAILAGIDMAYGWVAYHVIKVLLHEMQDTYEPYGSATDEDEEEAVTELRFIKEGGRSALSPLADPGPIIRVNGPKGEEWVICETNLIHFIERLPIIGLSKDSWMHEKLPAGRMELDKHGRLVIKNKKMTRWEHWAPFKQFLLHYGVLTPGGRDVDGMLLNAEGEPDVEAILEYLKLNGYAREEE